MNFITILKTIKAMWDLYQSFISAWNSMAEHHNRQEELKKQKFQEQQQKLRINSKKPQKIENRKKPENANKNPKTNSKQTTTKGPSTKLSTTTLANVESSNEYEGENQEATMKVKQMNKAKVEPRKASKGEKLAITEAEGLRTKRQTPTASTDVGEGRYIKGDPLKGYYDFVITEGSYKFWAVFQVSR